MPHQTLVVATDSHLSPDVLSTAIAEAAGDELGLPPFVEILLPAVLPAVLPISACPPRIAARLSTLRERAAADLRARRLRGRVEIVPCHSVPALLAAAEPVDTLVLAGRAGWAIRRAARATAPELLVIPGGRVRRRGTHRAAQPQALPGKS
jgi:hypothetical protein